MKRTYFGVSILIVLAMPAAQAQNLTRTEEAYVDLSRCSSQCMMQIRDGRNRLVEQSERMRKLLEYVWAGEEVTAELVRATELEYCEMYQDNARVADACWNTCSAIAIAYDTSDHAKETYLSPLTDFVVQARLGGIFRWPHTERFSGRISRSTGFTGSLRQVLGRSGAAADAGCSRQL